MLIYDTAPLRNPVNDARAMSGTLRELGFSVELLVNASQKEMKRAINRFGKQLSKGGVGLFYCIRSSQMPSTTYPPLNT
jgi:uncharacterized caspase-like protein